MEIALNSASSKRLVMGAGVLLSVMYMVGAARIFAASVLAGRPELSSLQHAVRIDPGDAEYQNRLGRYYAVVSEDPLAALDPYRAAVNLNPHSARYWFDLASAYQVLGDTANQTQALEHAIAVDPTTPDVAWQAANLYLVLGDTAKASHEFHVVLENDPTLGNLAMKLCWRIDSDVDSLLRDVVPARSAAYIAFLDLLMAKQQTAATAKVWAALMATPESFELRHVYEYLQYLLNQKDVDEALLVWQQAASRFGLSAYAANQNNLIVNGDFSLDVLNGGFDWQYQKQHSVSLTLDPTDSHGGHRSLLIAFDGPGVVDAGVRQFIAVRPNTPYEFSAYYKKGDFEGAGGPHLTIQDAYSQAVLYDSDELKEAGFWKSANGEFTTGNDCKLLILHVRRLPEGNPIRGKLWVDDFRLVAKSQ